MPPQRRAEAIAGLGPDVRRMLAHIATLGSARLTARSLVHTESDSPERAPAPRAQARELAELAAELTSDRATHGGLQNSDPLPR
ncbi:hypothetical protein [Granulicoccus phenolivorans]|uniref:hypothetical protein n=1 Tax=Granulicoccus phenolivorans TaxID=266854 RepID=UPI0003FC46A6|nr:hypothetical protein [Granulicoccus phenolivorans]